MADKTAEDYLWKIEKTRKKLPDAIAVRNLEEINLAEETESLAAILHKRDNVLRQIESATSELELMDDAVRQADARVTSRRKMRDVAADRVNMLKAKIETYQVRRNKRLGNNS